MRLTRATTLFTTERENGQSTNATILVIFTSNHRAASGHDGGDSWSIISYCIEVTATPCFLHWEYHNREAAPQTALHLVSITEPQGSGKAGV